MFKCCKGKEFSNFCCVICTEIFHPSCLERKPNSVKIQDHKIYCSLECKNKSILNLEMEKNLTEEINKLKGELKDKNSYIKRLKRGSQDTQNPTQEADKQSQIKIKAHKDKIEKLQEELAKFEEINKGRIRELKEHKDIIKNLKLELADVNKICREMVTSIKTLEEERDLLAQMMEHRKERPEAQSREVQCDLLQTVKNKTETYSKTMNTNEVPNNTSKKRLLILCDQNGYNLGNHLNNKLSNYSIETIVKPYASLDHIIENINILTQTFTKNDRVLIYAGFQSLIDGNDRCVLLKKIYSKLRYCSHTNLIFLSVPYLKYESEKNVLIYNLNYYLNDCLLTLDRYAEGLFTFIDINKNNYPIKKSDIAKLIKYNIDMGKKQNQNLTFITPNDAYNNNDKVVNDTNEIHPNTDPILTNTTASLPQVSLEGSPLRDENLISTNTFLCHPDPPPLLEHSM